VSNPTPDASVDRSTDLSQPLQKLSADERLKAGSRQLRGTILDSLADALTGAVSDNDAKLMKFHGIYQQDDRDLRDERRRQKLEPAYQFMIRVRLAGGVCTPAQWLQLSELALRHGSPSLRLTTRQTFQFHGVLKRDVKRVMQGLQAVLLDTIAACGDDTRGIMSSINPHLSSLHREVLELARATSDHVIPRMRAYHEIWLDGEKYTSSEPEEPVYGQTYLPRKFKFGFAIPPCNDIDVYSQDVGLIAIADGERLLGFNITVGGGLGRTDRVRETYPRLGDLLGYIPKEKLLDFAHTIVTVQRDYGNRADRARARFKYTVDDKGLPWLRSEIEQRLGFALEPAREFTFTSNGDHFGWAQGSDGRWHHTLFIENGRIIDAEALQLMTGLREIARAHHGEFRVTPNQNLVIANVAEADKAQMDALLERHGLDHNNRASTIRLNSMSCVGLPTCGLSMAESERYLPQFVSKLEPLLERHGLGGVPITLRMTGCPNGCARPYIAEIAFTGRALGRYNMYLGGGHHGQRLNRLYRENINEAQILEELDSLFAHYARDRHDGEHFGDFVVRAGHVRAVAHGSESYDP